MEELDWAARTAGQLRLVQADCADVEAKERRMMIEEEISRALRGIVPEKRGGFLKALVERFPVGEGAPAAAAKAEPKQGGALTPEEMVEELVALSRNLPKRQVQELGVRLQQAGFLPPSQAATVFDEPPEEFRQRFPLEPGQGVDLERLYKLTATLADFALGLDKIGWNLWKAIAPRSKVRKDTSIHGDLKALGGKYLSGDRETSLTQVNQVIDKLRQLVAGVLTAIGPAGRGFAKQYLARFSPEAIKALVSGESGLFVSAEQKCWRKYSELASEFSEDSVETELQESIARYAEDLMRGRGHD